MIDPTDTPTEDTGEKPVARILPNTVVPFGTGAIGGTPGVLPGIPVGTEGMEGEPSDENDEVWHYRTQDEVSGDVGSRATGVWHRDPETPSAGDPDEAVPPREPAEGRSARDLLGRIADTVTGDRPEDADA